MILRYQLLFLASFAVFLLAGCSKPDRPTITLYRAIQMDDIAQLERHIFWETDLNTAGPDGQIPLHLAAQKGSWVVCRILLDHGAKIDAPNKAGQTPLFVALIAGRTQVVDLLVKRGARFEPNALLLDAARLGVADRDVYGYLIKNGADIDTRDANGNSALHIAVAKGYRVVAKFLIARRADINATNKLGQRPLQIAIERQDQDIANLLRQSGANIGDNP